MNEFEKLSALYDIFNNYRDYNLKESNDNDFFSLSSINETFNSITGSWHLDSKYSGREYYLKKMGNDGFVNDAKDYVRKYFNLEDDHIINDPFLFIKEKLEADFINQDVMNPAKALKIFKYMLELFDKNGFSNVKKVITGKIRSRSNEYSELFENLEYTDTPVDIASKLYNINKQIKYLDCFNDFDELKVKYKKIIKNLQLLKRNHTEYEENHIMIGNIDNTIFPNTIELLNDLSNLTKDEHFNSYYTFIEHFKIQKVLNNIENDFESMDKIINSSGIYFSLAEEYIAKTSKNNDIQNFLDRKELKYSSVDGVMFELNMNKSQRHNTVLFFNDNSFIIQKKDGELKTYSNGFLAREDLDILFKDYINFKLRKNPTVNKFFNEQTFRNSSYLGAIKPIQTYLENEQILKSNKFTLENYKYYSFEEINDEMHHVIAEQQLKNYAHSIASNKYRELYDEESYKIIKEIKDMKIPESTLQDYVGKKIAAYKTPADFNEGLTHYFNSISEFTLDKMIDRANLQGSDIIVNHDNVLVVKIKTFEQSQSLGSSSWCISRDEHYFDSYVNDDNKSNQYFIYDFNIQSTSIDSMIGITLNQDGNYSTAHKKNDRHYPLDDSLKSIMLTIIKNDLSSYPVLDKNIKNQINNTIEKIGNTIKFN